ncbi:MAG: glycosyltransferase [Bacteroidota bacterium]|nr:glycosyltransferase [Bacteroidota bacterium]
MKISIIIATYNAQKRLGRCLDSILSQKTDDVELIIIDGGSKDQTRSIIEDYKSIVDYSISEKDDGIYHAWNKGVKIAKGDWIMFLGADDCLTPGAIRKIMQYLSSINYDECDYVSAKINYLDEQGQLIKIIGKAWCWIEFRNKMTVAHVGSLHSRMFFNEIGLFDTSYKICADYELLMRKKENLRACFMNEVIASMEFGGVSLSTAAIYETLKICNTYSNNNLIVKLYLLIRKLTEFYFFLFRYRISRIFSIKQ